MPMLIPLVGLPSGRCDDVVMQGVAFAGPAVCMVACAMLTPCRHCPRSRILTHNADRSTL